MTTAIEQAAKALRPFAHAVFNDNGDVTIETSRINTGDYLAAKSALARLTTEKPPVPPVNEAAARIAELEAERDRLKETFNEQLSGHAATIRERDRLKSEIEGIVAIWKGKRIRNLEAALQALYDDCAEYIRINHLHRGDGSSATENQVMRQARAALSAPSGE